MDKQLLQYGCLCDGQLRHISEVDNGLACGCRCPACKENLIAKKGNINVHHFAHVSGSDCPGARMSALHKLAQEIIENNKKVMLPKFDGKFAPKKEQLMCFDKVDIEVVVNESGIIRKPDCICTKTHNNEEHSVWIEIKVTHEVDEEKEKDIRTLKRACIEIDLSDMLDTEYTRDSIIYRIEKEHEDRRWVCCPKWETEEARLAKENEELEKRKKIAAAEADEKARQQINQRRKYFADIIEQWKQNSESVETKILEAISYDPYEKQEISVIKELLFQNEDWTIFIEQSPKNASGLKVFYELMKYYRRWNKQTNRYKLKEELKKLQYLKNNLSDAERITLEELVIVSLINSLEGARHYYSDSQFDEYAKLLIVDRDVRTKVLMLSSIIYRNIIGDAPAETFEDLLTLIKTQYPEIAQICLETIDNKSKFTTINYIASESIEEFRKFVESSSNKQDDRIVIIMRTCFSKTFSTNEKEEQVMLPNETWEERVAKTKLLNQEYRKRYGL